MSFQGIQDLKLKEGTIYDRSKDGKTGYSLPVEDLDQIESLIPKKLQRKNLDLPEVTELDVVRHFTRLSTFNYGVDSGFYPLGSCTMKYNPKINEKLARTSEFLNLHPETPQNLSQGALKMMYDLQEMLAEIGGFDAVSLTPSAGAHGEYAGLDIIRKYFKMLGETKRKNVIIPDSAHGTNPASCTLNGFNIILLKSNSEGKVDLKDLKELLNEQTAALMLTNPNTLGVFESDIIDITKACHESGALVYGDGANMNALLGIVRPGDMGIDVMHYNLHKTFSTPHGGGGPGSGPIGVLKKLTSFLPTPIVIKNENDYALKTPENSIGMIRSFYGNFGVNLRAYVYILEMGRENLPKVAKGAVLSANYIKACLSEHYNITYDKDTLHEAVFDDSLLPNGVTTLDVAKSLIDRGYHPPTIYFPLIVKGAIMIEPTETESKEELDLFIQAMVDIALAAEKDPDSLKSSPLLTVVSRPDEIAAARKPLLRL